MSSVLLFKAHAFVVLCIYTVALDAIDDQRDEASMAVICSERPGRLVSPSNTSLLEPSRYIRKVIPALLA